MLTRKQEAASDLYEALKLCMRELERQDRKHTEAYMRSQIAVSQALGTLRPVEEEEITGVAV